MHSSGLLTTKWRGEPWLGLVNYSSVTGLGTKVQNSWVCAIPYICHVVSGFKEAPDDSCASSCNLILMSLIFQVQEDFCLTDQIFWHNHVPAWDPDPTARKSHLTCQSKENITQQLETNKPQHTDFNRRLNGMFTVSTFFMHSSILLFVDCF